MVQVGRMLLLMALQPSMAAVAFQAPWSTPRIARKHLTFLANSPGTENKDKKPGKDKEPYDDEADFYAFLQRISQLPLVNGKVEDSKKQSEESSSSSPSARNPFLSPFFGLLNFEEVIGTTASTTQDNNAKQKVKQPEPSTTTSSSTSEGILSWGNFVNTLRQTIGDPFSSNQTIVPVATTTTKEPVASSSFLSSASMATDDFVREATTRVEAVLLAASTAVSADAFSFTSMIQQARNVLKFQDDLVAAAIAAAKDRGLDALEAAERARNTTDYVASLVAVADQVLRYGYVQKEESYAAIAGDRNGQVQRQARKILAENMTSSSSSNPLFENIASAKAISYNEFGPAISTIAEMGWLAGGIYENAMARPQELEHSIVAEGISADVLWMVTDSIENEADYDANNNNNNKAAKDIPVRTFIVRGFDASDERVDRELLFTEICNLQSQPFDDNMPGLLVHRGLYGIAKAVYNDIQRYIDWSAPAQKIIFTGHSIGGSISILLTLMLARDRGADFVRGKILRVFTFGCPPTLRLDTDVEPKRNKSYQRCSILELYGLPSSLVYGLVQPWDPIVRLFSPIDGLYPLIDDLGEDGMTLYSSGPPRSLRLVTRALVEAWEGWPRFRDMVRSAGPQGYQAVGLQHIILPEPVRYLTDRFVNVNVNVPPADEIVRVAPDELYKALETIFPLDVFELSYVTSAIRGFLHHFYPAYDAPLVDYAQKVSKRGMVRTKQEELVQNIEASTLEEKERRSSSKNSRGRT